MQAEATHGFVATLSNGTTAAEHTEQWQLIDGARKPIVRLCQFLAENNLFVTSLRYNANGQTYHIPKLDTRFNKGGLQPDHYSTEYIYERDEGFEGVTEKLFVDLGAFYGDVSVHTIFEVGGQHTLWVQVRNKYRPMLLLPAINKEKE